MDNNEIYNKIVEEIKEKTLKPCISLELSKEDCTQFDNKLRGTPYIPNGFDYPYSRTHINQPLKLLAQINFERIPHLKDFPTKGILQFYINPIDDNLTMYGLNYQEEWSCIRQDDFRVIYHENVDYSANNLDKIPNIPIDEDYGFVIPQEFKLNPVLENRYIDLTSYGFYTILDEVYSKYIGHVDEAEVTRRNYPKDFNDILWDNFFEYNGIHKMGGYSFHTQDSPQYYDGTEEYSILLLQINSDIDADIMWGDDGVANFFIKLKDLKSLDFSNVLYNWDCY